MTPQLFVGVSLGAGLNKILDKNQEPPTFYELLFTPDVYLPLTGLGILIIIAFLLRRFFYK